ncbi:MAG: DUF1648 domain-containing protein [Phycisphaerae bacterium]|nr:DUF1648 domain-containing protein [Phycisphaerae bacterium]
MPPWIRWSLHTVALTLPWIVAIWLGASLPDRYPVHFDGAGTPDRWAGPGHGEWYMLAGISSFVQFVLIGVMALTPFFAVRAPDYINVPAKASFVKLQPAARVRCLAPMFDLLTMIALFISLLFARIFHGTWQVATGERTTLAPWDVIVLVTLILAATAWQSIVTRRRILTEAARQL